MSLIVRWVDYLVSKELCEEGMFKQKSEWQERQYEVRRRTILDRERSSQSLCCRNKLSVATEQKMGHCGLGRVKENHVVRFCSSRKGSTQAGFLRQEEEFWAWWKNHWEIVSRRVTASDLRWWLAQCSLPSLVHPWTPKIEATMTDICVRAKGNIRVERC